MALNDAHACALQSRSLLQVGSLLLPRAPLARAAAALFAIGALVLLAGHTAESSEHASAAVQYVKSSTQKYVGSYCPPGHGHEGGGGGGGRTNPLAHTVDVLDSIAPEAFDDGFIHVAVDERAGYVGYQLCAGLAGIQRPRPGPNSADNASR